MIYVFGYTKDELDMQFWYSSLDFNGLITSGGVVIVILCSCSLCSSSSLGRIDPFETRRKYFSRSSNVKAFTIQLRAEIRNTHAFVVSLGRDRRSRALLVGFN